MEVRLGFWEPSLAPALAACANDPNILRWFGDYFPSPYELSDAELFIRMMKSDEISYCRAVFADGKVVGNISLGEKHGALSRCFDLGYWINSAYWGRGIMTRAVRAFCEVMFRKEEVARIQAHVIAPNVASCRVLEKCGFTKEGVLRRCAYKYDAFYDVVVYGLLASERGKA